MDQSEIRLGFPAIAALIAAEHPNKPTPCRKPARVPAPPGYWEERLMLDVQPSGDFFENLERAKALERTAYVIEA